MIDAVAKSDSLKDLRPVIPRHFELHLFFGAVDFVVLFQPLKKLFCTQGNDYPDDDNADFGRQFPPIVNWFGLVNFQFGCSFRCATEFQITKYGWCGRGEIRAPRDSPGILNAQ